MPFDLNAPTLLAMTVALSARARALAQEATPDSHAELARIELETSNIRLLLTGSVRRADTGYVLEACKARLADHAARLAELEGPRVDIAVAAREPRP